MTVISIVSTLPAPEMRVNGDLRTIAPFCFLGLVASLCLVTFGVDLSASWI
jgi:hypothetical protein